MGYKTYLLVQSIESTHRPPVKTSKVRTDKRCVTEDYGPYRHTRRRNTILLDLLKNPLFAVMRMLKLKLPTTRVAWLETTMDSSQVLTFSDQAQTLPTRSHWVWATQSGGREGWSLKNGIKLLRAAPRWLPLWFALLALTPTMQKWNGLSGPFQSMMQRCKGKRWMRL